MKNLLLMRHAKSSWKNESLTDHDRPLNARGKRDAPRIGRLLIEQNIVPDWIVCSTAKRARRTAALVADAAEFQGEMQLTDDLYHASPMEILEVVRRLDSQSSAVLVIAHNPGLEQLVDILTVLDEPFPTAALAQLHCDIPNWSTAHHQMPARLIHLWRPREIG